MLDSMTLRPPRREADVVKYNEIAARVMTDNKIPTDDLFKAILPQQAELRVKNNVHFTKPGYRFLAQQVADSIKAALTAPYGPRRALVRTPFRMVMPTAR